MQNKNFLTLKLREAAKKNKKLCCIFLTLGYPDLAATERLILSAERSGVDIIELGFPFSDPLADGPTIQDSSEKALAKGATVRSGFRLVRRLRRRGCEIPLVFFGYMNPVYSYGGKDFVRDARAAGLDGLIIPDLPIEEEKDFQKECSAKGLHIVRLVAPTTKDARALKLVRSSGGFVYYVSLRGVTGARKALPDDLAPRLRKLRKMTSKPILAGFGISTPAQAAAISKIADGVVVGSAVINRIRNGIPAAEHFIDRMARAVHSADGHKVS
ncbi:MAG: Tryptophan synthase alpha chain [Candidatus Omnitrophica bacterium ADurb.Bin277]|nr:MAG: Tryptophan synthase alpha chain [Candidatus Omnitrophica bacterium ADurb.Bin277]